VITALQTFSHQIISQPVPEYKRFLYHTIDFQERLIGIIGARGTGKTTLILQHLKARTRPETVLFLLGDHPLVTSEGLYAIADAFQQRGGQVLVIDEIHKISDFEIALKLIYDSFHHLQVFFTGSSAVALDHARADLSRRAMIHTLPVLSFREYLELEHGVNLPSFSLEHLLRDHISAAMEILDQIKPLAHWEGYLREGAYPFYRDGREGYLPKLLASTLQVLATDLPSLYAIEHDKIEALKKMLIMLCRSEPYDVNISKLCGAVELNRRTLYKYLGILQSASLVRILGAKTSGVSIISKPEKLYLDNTNLFGIFCDAPMQGTRRETFFGSALGSLHTLSYPKSGGDFVVDERYLFEIGGKTKTSRQIKDHPESFIAADDIEIGNSNKIPLWLFGFLY